MNPLHETFQFLYANRQERGDPHPAFGALAGSTILGFLNLIVLGIWLEPLSGFFNWFDTQGWTSIALVASTNGLIGALQYFAWISGGKLEKARAIVEQDLATRKFRVFAYIVVSIVAVPISASLMHQLGK